MNMLESCSSSCCCPVKNNLIAGVVRLIVSTHSEGVVNMMMEVKRSVNKGSTQFLCYFIEQCE